jgi:5-methylcytosine-specific restriction protein A
VKRPPMPARRKPMSPGSAVLRRGALLRQSEMTRTAAASRKPVKRDPADPGPTVAVRQAVLTRAGLRCERCGTSVEQGPRQVHHRKPRGMGGSTEAGINSPANLLLLCPSCHVAVESSRKASFEQGWLVHRDHDPARVPVWIARRGFVLLNSVGDYITDEDTAA